MSDSSIPTGTGKPLEHYEPYVEFIAELLANGFALAADRSFLSKIDPSKPLIPQFKQEAWDSIQWRYAHLIEDLETKIAATKAVSSETVDRETAELGGPVPEVVRNFYTIDYLVPDYPNIILDLSDPKSREGYLFQEVPGGFRYISIDIPDWELLPDGVNERQLPAPDAFGPVCETLEEAGWTAWNHFHEVDIDDDYRVWSQALAELAKRAPSYEAP